MPAIDEVIKKHIELRDRKAEMGKRHSEELAPLSGAMGDIENYLMHTMNTLGVDQLKSGEYGTAFKSTSTSCQLQDPIAFKDFVFAPVSGGVMNYLASSGYAVRDVDAQVIHNIIRDLPMWDMIDFRAGKKGITEYVANENKTVPGVALNTVATVNIRRA